MLPETKTKLWLSTLVFAIATIFFGLGFVLEKPLLSEQSWMTIAIAVLGIYSAGRVWTDVASIHKNGGG